MLVVLIVIPAVIVAMAVVLVLDRIGVLPRLDGGPSARSSSDGFLTNIPKAGLLAAGGAMIVWIVAWLLFLVIGLSMLAG